MKIDSYRANVDAHQKSERADTIKRAESGAAEKAAGGKGSDAVHLSSDAQLAAKALTALERTDGVRADVVERAKQLLASGELGRNADRLADAILDRTLATADSDR